MSKFKIGDRVRDVSPHGPGLGHSAGTIVGREYDTWVIEWDATGFGRINWSDDQIEHLTPSIPSPIVTETVTRIVEWEGEHGIKVRTPPEADCPFIRLGADYINLTPGNVPRMRALAAVLTQLADHLESQKP